MDENKELILVLSESKYGKIRRLVENVYVQVYWYYMDRYFHFTPLISLHKGLKRCHKSYPP